MCICHLYLQKNLKSNLRQIRRLKLENDKLAKIAYEIDDIIAGLSVKYKIDPLSLTSIVLARIVLTNDYVGSGEDFRKILANIPQSRMMNNEVVH